MKEQQKVYKGTYTFNVVTSEFDGYGARLGGVFSEGRLRRLIEKRLAEAGYVIRSEVENAGGPAVSDADNPWAPKPPTKAATA